MPTPGTQYSTIPIPPPVPSYSPSLSSQSESDPDRASRYNKWSMILFLAIILLLILDNDKDSVPFDGGDGDDLCGGRWRFTRNLTDFELSPHLDDIRVTMSGMVSHVIVEQAQDNTNVRGTTKLIIEGSGADREDVNTINRFVKQDMSDNSVTVGITRFPGVGYPDCLRVVVKIIFPTFKTNVRRLKFAVSEGNVTVNLLENNNENDHTRNRPSIQVQELDSRVITGHSHIHADVPTWIRLGGSVGTMTGEVVVGKEMSVAMVDGNVTLNLVQRHENNKMESKIAVNNGNIRIGLPTQYEGTFKLQTLDGKIDVQIQDPARTHLTTITDTSITGWSSSMGKEPYTASELKLSSRSGDVTLSMARIDV
ncbi:hypothetical protein BGZ51_006828 [Haplosporangium sp. Z 767]|nr:hypothetical protein BGZ51_006828 [Haplosporangium sp. Z 767]